MSSQVASYAAIATRTFEADNWFVEDVDDGVLRMSKPGDAELVLSCSDLRDDEGESTGRGFGTQGILGRAEERLLACLQADLSWNRATERQSRSGSSFLGTRSFGQPSFMSQIQTNSGGASPSGWFTGAGSSSGEWQVPQQHFWKPLLGSLYVKLAGQAPWKQGVWVDARAGPWVA